MINFDECYKMFKDYLKEYDMEDNKIDLKYHHSFRVADISSRIAISLNLAKEEIDIAKLTGLLHDIGRFEQETEFHSFKDAKTKDHGYRGSFILFNKGYIKKYIKEDKYDDLIEKAIYSHNKLNIPDEYNEREVLFSKIIRDADKIDILYINSNIDIKSDVGDDDITSEVIESLKKHELIDIQYIHTKLDDVLLMVDFVFDIYFKYSYNTIKENKYVDIILDKIQTKDEDKLKLINEIRNDINNYIDKKVDDNNVR